MLSDPGIPKAYQDFIEKVRERLDKYGIRNIDIEGFTPAAVFILFMNKDGRPHVLLTKRTDMVKTHKGQVSFPGGARDKADADILDAAYRETFEEVGIPRDKIEFLGRFDDYVAVSYYRVSVFVGSFDYPLEYKVNDMEIDVCIEAPFEIFLNEDYDRIGYNLFEGKYYKVFYYNFEDHVIWGLTARMLTDLARLLRNDLSI